MARKNIKDKRRQQLIEANMAAIAKFGYADTTIAHVSKGAGMSRGIINFYFTSKELMMEETLAALTNDYLQQLEKPLESNASPETKLISLIQAHFQSSLLNKKKIAVWIAFWGETRSSKTFTRLLQEADTFLTRQIKQLAAQASQLEEGNEEIGQFAEALTAMIRGNWLRYSLNPANETRAGMEASVCQFAEEQLRKLRGAEIIPISSRQTPKTPPKKKAEQVEQEANVNQLDFEDLFNSPAQKKQNV